MCGHLFKMLVLNLIWVHPRAVKAFSVRRGKQPSYKLKCSKGKDKGLRRTEQREEEGGNENGTVMWNSQWSILREKWGGDDKLQVMHVMCRGIRVKRILLLVNITDGWIREVKRWRAWEEVFVTVGRCVLASLKRWKMRAGGCNDSLMTLSSNFCKRGLFFLLLPRQHDRHRHG